MFRSFFLTIKIRVIFNKTNIEDISLFVSKINRLFRLSFYRNHRSSDKNYRNQCLLWLQEIYRKNSRKFSFTG